MRRTDRKALTTTSAKRCTHSRGRRTVAFMRGEPRTAAVAPPLVAPSERLSIAIRDARITREAEARCGTGQPASSAVERARAIMGVTDDAHNDAEGRDNSGQLPATRLDGRSRARPEFLQGLRGTYGRPLVQRSREP
jgi:hypothetical protein